MGSLLTTARCGDPDLTSAGTLMAGTHHQLLFHYVFSTKNRKPYLQPKTRGDVFSYLGATIRDLGGTPIRIGGWVDHVHLLVRLNTTHCIASFIREVKCNSTRRFNRSNERFARFGWQVGYGVFSVSPGSEPSVARYIENQVRHHATESFRSEYLRMLQSAGVDYDERYLWD